MGIPRGAQGGSNFVPAQTQPIMPQTSSNIFSTNQTPYTPTPVAPYRGTGNTGQVLGTNTGLDVNASTQNINQNTEDLGSIIDRDYETSMQNFNIEEQGLRRQGETAQKTVEAEYAPARTAIQEEQATRETGLEGERSLAQTQEKSAMQQARDLYRQTEQKNIAQLSGLGISSSSVAEALAERLGVETARRISGITGSAQEVYQNIQKELTRVGTYYKQKLADLEQRKAASMAEIQTALLQGIDTINKARNTAASDKANRRAELMRNAQNSIFQLQQQAMQFAQSLQMWQQQRTSALSDAQQFVVTPTDFSALQSAAQSVQNISGMGLGNFTPEFSIAPSGKVTTTLRGKKEDEDITNPFATSP